LEGTLTIPNSVTMIGDEAFYDCTSLTSLVFEANSSLETIGDVAFGNCNKLAGTLTIPNSVTIIGDSAFFNCTSLTSLNLGSGVQELDNNCFRNIPFTYIYFQSPTTPLTTLGSNLFNVPLSPLTVTYYYAPNGETDLNPQMVTLKNTYFPANTTTFIYLASCFAEGTKILCLENNEETWIKVEELKINTLVKTYLHGHKPVKRIGKGTFINNPKQPSFSIYKMSKENNPLLIEDLYLTGGHSIMVDCLMDEERKEQEKIDFHQTIDDKKLEVVYISRKFEKIIDNNIYNVYNFALESETGDQRYGVYANGELCETPSMNSIMKNQFSVILKEELK
jgi:hypothetical protein